MRSKKNNSSKKKIVRAKRRSKKSPPSTHRKRAKKAAKASAVAKGEVGDMAAAPVAFAGAAATGHAAPLTPQFTLSFQGIEAKMGGGTFVPDTSHEKAAAQIAAEHRKRQTAAVQATAGTIEPPSALKAGALQPQPPLNEPQLAPLSTPPDTFDDLELDEAVELIKEWFLSNFEDPAHQTPFESAEGGYQYIWGGPYDARDVIGDAFAEAASEQVIEAAVRAIEANGITDWVPHGNRVRLHEDDEAADGGRVWDSIALHADMLQRVAALEDTMAQLSGLRPGIGHNNPPGPIELVPFADDDLLAVETAIAVLKAQPPGPAAAPAEAIEACIKLKTIGERLNAYLVKQGDTFISEAVKSAGSEVGKRLIQSPFWLVLASSLLAAAAAVQHWLASLGPPL